MIIISTLLFEWQVVNIDALVGKSVGKKVKSNIETTTQNPFTAATQDRNPSREISNGCTSI